MSKATFWNFSKNDSVEEIEKKLRKVTKEVIASYSSITLLSDSDADSAECLEAAFALGDFMMYLYTRREEEVVDIAKLVCKEENRSVVKIGLTSFARMIEEGIVPVCVSFMNKSKDKDFGILDCWHLCKKLSLVVDKILEIAGIEEEYPFERVHTMDVYMYLRERFHIDT